MKSTTLSTTLILIGFTIAIPAIAQPENITCVRENNQINCPNNGSFDSSSNTINNGDLVVPTNNFGSENDVENIYFQVLGRKADSGGLKNYTQAISDRGWTLNQVRQQIAASPELGQMINQAYQQYLGRNAEARGMQSYRRSIANGKSINDVRNEIANSREARTRNSNLSRLSVNNRYNQSSALLQLADSPSIQPIEISINRPIAESSTKPELEKTQIAQSTQPTSVQLAQSEESSGLKATRGGYSYVGIAGNFSITGSSDLGGRSLAIISKIGLNNSISIRPSILFLSSDAAILVPVTYDFTPFTIFGPNFSIAPYLGAGLGIKTGSNNNFGPLITAGVDIPISRSFTANVAANLSFLRNTDLSILVGIAYNF
jgi:hypothetical protein